MLLSDQLWARLTCKKCGQQETRAANNKGFGFPDWGNLSPFVSFDVTASDGAGREPVVSSAKCQGCGSDALVETQHGLKRPEGY